MSKNMKMIRFIDNEINKINNIVFAFLMKFELVHIQKDVGQIPINLCKTGYNVTLVTYLQNKNIKKIDGVKIVKIGEDNLIDNRLIDFKFIYYILKNAKNIDWIIGYKVSPTYVITSFIFKLLKRRGIFIVKMDSNGRLYVEKIFRGEDGKFLYKRNFISLSLLRFIGNLIFRILNLTCNFIIIESPEARKRVLSYHPYLKKKLIVLQNGTDGSLWDVYITKFKRKKRGEKSKKILFVGSIIHRKGVDLLLKAFYRLGDKFPDWKLELIGEMPPLFKNKIKRLISKLGNKVILTKFVTQEDLARKYMEAEIFCLPSRNEASSLVLFEAMYFGKAIVASDIGSAKYNLNYGKAGLIFENENLNELTEKLEQLMKNDYLRKKLGKEAGKRCRKLFTWKEIITQLDNYMIC